MGAGGEGINFDELVQRASALQNCDQDERTSTMPRDERDTTIQEIERETECEDSSSAFDRLNGT